MGIQVSIVIDRSSQIVWKYFTNPKNWKKWHGAILKEVNPGWKEGATLIWENDDTSQVSILIPEKMVQIESRWVTDIFRFKRLNNKTTLVEHEFEARGGAFFLDGGLASKAAMASSLKKLKEYVEREIQDIQEIAIKHENKKWWQFWK